MIFGNVYKLCDHYYLNEDYYGSSEKLDKLVEYFDMWKEYINRDPYYKENPPYATFAGVNMQSLSPVRKLLKDLFGFKQAYVILVVGQSHSIVTNIDHMKSSMSVVLEYNDFLNYARKCLNNITDLDPRKIDKTMGLRFTSAFPTDLYVYIGSKDKLCLGNPHVTGRHMVAALLHEIGHNFYTFYQRLKIIEKYESAINNVQDLYAKENELAMQTSAEAFSDKFVAMYGFGPDLTELLGLNLDDIPNVIQTQMSTFQYSLQQKEEIENFLIMTELRRQRTNEHPMDLSRIKEMLLQLRVDFQKGNYHPQHKIQLLADIEAMRQYITRQEEKLHSLDPQQRKRANMISLFTQADLANNPIKYGEKMRMNDMNNFLKSVSH